MKWSKILKNFSYFTNLIFFLFLEEKALKYVTNIYLHISWLITIMIKYL